MNLTNESIIKTVNSTKKDCWKKSLEKNINDAANDLDIWAGSIITNGIGVIITTFMIIFDATVEKGPFLLNINFQPLWFSILATSFLINTILSILICSIRNNFGRKLAHISLKIPNIYLLTIIYPMILSKTYTRFIKELDWIELPDTSYLFKEQTTIIDCEEINHLYNWYIRHTYQRILNEIEDKLLKTCNMIKTLDNSSIFKEHEFTNKVITELTQRQNELKLLKSRTIQEQKLLQKNLKENLDSQIGIINYKNLILGAELNIEMKNFITETNGKLSQLRQNAKFLLEQVPSNLGEIESRIKSLGELQEVYT